MSDGRPAMAAFLRTLVHDQSLITDELIEERYALAADPEALRALARQPLSDPPSTPQILAVLALSLREKARPPR